MIKGKLVALRAVEKDDLSFLMEWRNRSHYRQYFREYRELNLDNQLQWYNSLVVNDRSTIMFVIVNASNPEERLGCCGLCYINWVQRFADLSLYIGWKDTYIDDVGYAKEACDLLFKYGFGELGLHKIWTEIYEFDKPKYNLYTEMGFKQDGLLRDNYFHEGKWHNSRIMSLLCSDYKI